MASEAHEPGSEGEHPARSPRIVRRSRHDYSDSLLDLDRDAPRAALVHHPDHVMPGRLGGARDVGRALRVVEEETDLLACRQRLETDLGPGPAERALDAPQVERVTRHASPGALRRAAEAARARPGSRARRRSPS